MIRKSKGKNQQRRCPLTTSKRKRAAANKLTATVKDIMPPGLARPALRALAAAGFTTLDSFTRIKEADLLKLHGMGPKAAGIIRAALKESGWTFLS